MDFPFHHCALVMMGAPWNFPAAEKLVAWKQKIAK